MKSPYHSKFVAFIESICTQYGCTDAIKPLTEGFNAFDEDYSDNPENWESYWKITYDDEAEAGEEEYNLRDGWGSVLETAVVGNEIRIKNDTPMAEKVAKDWFGDRAVLVVPGVPGGDSPENIANALKNLCQEAGCPELGNTLVEGLESLKEPFMIRVEFTNEDSAYDALSGLEHFKEQNLHPEWNPYIDEVDFDKDYCTITVKGPNKEFLDYLKGYIEETDIDSVVDYGG